MDATNERRVFQQVYLRIFGREGEMTKRRLFSLTESMPVGLVGTFRFFVGGQHIYRGLVAILFGDPQAAVQ